MVWDVITSYSIHYTKLYDHTRDVTAALYRKQTYSFDKALYVTDYAQNLHFAQLFKVVGLMGYDWAEDEMIHVPFGRVTLEGMSLSTRKGNVVKLVV